jgi:hypothetical protein
MVSLVERTAAGVDLHKKLASEGTPHVKIVPQRQIEATDRQIDALVYELYGLTAEEIAVVGGRTLTAALPDRGICGRVVLVARVIVH